MARASIWLAIAGIVVVLIPFLFPSDAMQAPLKFLRPMVAAPPIYWNPKHLLDAVAGLLELAALVTGAARFGSREGKIAVAIAAPSFALWFLFAVVAEIIKNNSDY